MSIQQPAPQVPGAANSPPGKSFIFSYLEALSLVERLHRLLLDVIKDEFERVGVLEINAVQALLLFNIGDNEVTAGELKSRGYYQGSNVSYNRRVASRQRATGRRHRRHHRHPQTLLDRPDPLYLLTRQGRGYSSRPITSVSNSRSSLRCIACA